MCRAQSLFRRHIQGSAGDKSLFAAACLVLGKGQAEVDQHGRAFGGKNDVVWFDVPVNDEPGVCVRKSVGNSGDDPCRLTPGRAVLPQPAAEVDAFQVIGNDIHLPVLHADVVYRHNAGVAQLRKLTRLTHRLFPRGQKLSGFAMHHLDGHRPVELRVVT